MLAGMARTDPQVNFRIPADLLEKIKAEAAVNNRTITAELVSRLEASFQPSPAGEIRMTHEQLQDMVQSIVDDVTAALAR